MPKIKDSPDILLTVYITHLFLLTGHCQFTGRRYDVSRTRFREQIPGAYRPSQLWNGGQSFARDNYNSRPSVSGYRGNLNNHSRLRNRQNVRGRAPNAQTQYYDQRYGLAGRNSQPSVSAIRNNRLLDRTRYSTISNRDGRVYGQRPYVVPVTMTNERFQYSTRGSVNSHANNPGSTRQFSPYNREFAFNGRSSSRDGTIPLSQGRSSVYRPAYNSSVTSSPEQSYQSSNGNQFSGRFDFPRRFQSAADGIRNYSPMSTNGDNFSQYQLTASRLATRPRLQTERNEVFQYRTSVMRAPQSDISGSRNYDDRQRFSGNPVQSLSLPFEPLSLRYQGFRNSKIAGQQGILSDRVTNVNTRNIGRSLDTGTPQTEVQFGRSSDMQLTDRTSSFDNGNTNGAMNSGTFQPATGSVQRQRFPHRTTNFVSRNTGRITGNDRTFQLDIPVQGRLRPDRTTNVADRNTARIGNTRTFFPGMQSERTYSGTTNFNQRQARQIRFNRNIQPATGFQRGLGQTRASTNDVGFRNSQQNGNRRRFRVNNAQTNRNGPVGSLRDIFGISRAGLENALKRDAPQVEQSVQGGNTNPISNNVQVVGTRSNQRQRQRTGVPNFVLGRDTNTGDMTEQKANLITDIRRSMDIADKMNLFRNRHVSDNEQSDLPFRPVPSDNTDNERITVLTVRSPGNSAQSRNIIILRHNPREADNATDDIEDGFIGGHSSVDDKSSTNSDNNENDEENEDY
ncbi:uncharacterized protein LOC123547150 [Mercenaria mercenaria]|uniref:uncharacterized protein LOC123547150 n=1 Tax=Mercenaria mercenaria TaxID=6596 RepID=UPI00234EBFFF|nr:uncharacterized protein LOC123547150 [Mercenaria mercenaria]